MVSGHEEGPLRLWSIHPSLLDRAGLMALYRESLLARHVLGNAPGATASTLKRKLQQRDPARLRMLPVGRSVLAHPMFTVVPWPDRAMGAPEVLTTALRARAAPVTGCKSCFGQEPVYRGCANGSLRLRGGLFGRGDARRQFHNPDVAEVDFRALRFHTDVSLFL